MLTRGFVAGLKQRGDVYQFHDPELLPFGVVLKLLGKRIVYDVHEDVPRQILGKYRLPRVMRRPVVWAMAILEFLGARSFDAEANGLFVPRLRLARPLQPGDLWQVLKVPIARVEH